MYNRGRTEVDVKGKVCHARVKGVKRARRGVANALLCGGAVLKCWK